MTWALAFLFKSGWPRRFALSLVAAAWLGVLLWLVGGAPLRAVSAAAFGTHPRGAGVTSYSGKWDSCIAGEAFVVNLDASKPSVEEAKAALDACWRVAPTP